MSEQTTDGPHPGFWTGLAEALMTVCADRVRIRAPRGRDDGAAVIRALQEHFGGTLSKSGDRLTFGTKRKDVFLEAIAEHKDGVTSPADWARGYFLGAARLKPTVVEVTRTLDPALIARLRAALVAGAPQIRVAGSDTKVAVYDTASRAYVRDVWMAYPPAPEMSISDANARADRRLGQLIIQTHGATKRTPQPRLTDAMKARIVDLYNEPPEWDINTIAHIVARESGQVVAVPQVRHVLNTQVRLSIESRPNTPARRLPDDIRRRVIADLNVRTPPATVRHNIMSTGIDHSFVPSISTIAHMLKASERVPAVDHGAPTWFELAAKYGPNIVAGEPAVRDA